MRCMTYIQSTNINVIKVANSNIHYFINIIICDCKNDVFKYNIYYFTKILYNFHFNIFDKYFDILLNTVFHYT